MRKPSKKKEKQEKERAKHAVSCKMINHTWRQQNSQGDQEKRLPQENSEGWPPRTYRADSIR